jgi:hypothetical protein
MHINKRKRVRKDLTIHAHLHTGISGYFTVDLIEAATGRVKRHLEFKNLITDAGLNALNNTTIATWIGQAGLNGFMGCGTNATAPANADTTLGAEIAPASSHRTNSNGGIAEVFGAGPANAYWFRKVTYNFVEAQANGNLTEIGLFSAVTGGTMFCRQLLKDGTGTPTVVVKTAADQLRVTYEIRFYSPADVTVNPLAISGSNYSVTTRAIHIDGNRLWGHDNSNFSIMVGFKGDNCNSVNMICSIDSNTLVAQTGANPSGTIFTPTSVAKSAYVNGNFWLDYTVIWDPGVSNPAGGVGGILLRCDLAGGTVGTANCEFQMAFTPKLPKDNTKRLTLVMRLSWGRGP